MRTAIVVLGLLLAGCQGLNFASDDERAIDECQYLGLRPGSEPFAACYERVRARLSAQNDESLNRAVGAFDKD